MNKVKLSSEQFDYESKDSIISFVIKTNTRRLKVFVRPFIAFVVLETKIEPTYTDNIIFHKIYYENIDEWNAAYEKLIKSAGKNYSIVLQERVRPSVLAMKARQIYKN